MRTTMNEKIKSYRGPWRVTYAVLLLSTVIFASCWVGMIGHFKNYRELKSYARAHEENRDYSTERISENGLYRISFIPQTDPIPLSQLHTWTIRIESADGTGIEDAAINVDGGMPEHGHGLPTRPQVTQALGNGDYLVEGMKFQMPGWWIVRFDVTTTQGSDTVTFNLML